MKQVNNLYKSLIKVQNRVFYVADRINRTLINIAKTSLYANDKVFVKLYKGLENVEEIYSDENSQPNLPLRTPLCRKKEILIIRPCIVLMVPLNLYLLILLT